jgi:hypothetical protein
MICSFDTVLNGHHYLKVNEPIFDIRRARVTFYIHYISAGVIRYLATWTIEQNNYNDCVPIIVDVRVELMLYHAGQ